jgi:hypothetical protein
VWDETQRVKAPTLPAGWVRWMRISSNGDGHDWRAPYANWYEKLPPLFRQVSVDELPGGLCYIRSRVVRRSAEHPGSHVSAIHQ